jgi:hypothetical protein
MNITLWILQALLALHTAMGAVWKITNSEQAVGSLKAIPHWVWMGMIGLEFLCAVALVLPAVSKPLGILAPLAAAVIVAEMVYFCAVHFASGNAYNFQVTYWLVVAALCAFIAYGRFVLKPF